MALRWDLEWGPHLAFLLSVKRDLGVDPPALKSRPVLMPGLDLYMRAFFEMNKRRPRDGWGSPLPISYEQVDAYTRMHGWQRDTVLDLLTHLDSMDDYFLKWLRDKDKPESTPEAKEKK